MSEPRSPDRWRDERSASPAQPPGEGRPARGGVGAGTLAVAALAVGVLACGFSWMFFIRLYIVLAGAVAVVLGLMGVLVAHRGRHSLTLAAAGVVLGLLSIVSVFTTEVLVRNYIQDRLGSFVSGLDSSAGAEPTDTATLTPAAPTADPSTGTSPSVQAGVGQTDPAGGTPPPPSGDLAPNNSQAPLPVGQSGELTDLTLTVTSVTTDAAEAIEGGGNPPPTNGRYMLVEVSATNNGEITANVGSSLVSVGLAGGDGLEYSSTSCNAVLDQPASAVPPLEAGETGTWQVCIDTRPGALEGASLFVSQLMATREVRVYWQLG
jgi:hypothetical protein